MFSHDHAQIMLSLLRAEISSHLGQARIFEGWQSPDVTTSYGAFPIVYEGVGQELLRGDIVTSPTN